MVLINLDSHPEANSPTQSMCSLMEAASLGSGLSPVQAPGPVVGLGLFVCLQLTGFKVVILEKRISVAR